MVFSSSLFLFGFLPITLIAYFALQERYRNAWLLLVSIAFFSWSQPQYLWILIGNILINYGAGRLIGRYPQKRSICLFVAVILNLALLFYFKYFNFFISSINEITSWKLAVDKIVLPIGISFFTFQGMSYTFDVYRGIVSVQKNIFKLALYIVLFPQLIAGPIVRYTDIAKEIDQRSVGYEDFADGAARFIKGFSKKVIIANTMAAVVDSIWKYTNPPDTAVISWLGSIAILGFHFNENFNLPYMAKSVSDFWRRWHISLSSWFRDYVYIPLGGNRKAVWRNLAVVFLLTGLWHGAAWNFVLWGAWHGFFVIAEKYWRSRQAGTSLECSLLRLVAARIYTLFVVNLGWVLFRADSIKSGIAYIKTMFGVSLGTAPGFSGWWYLDRWTTLILFLAILFATDIPKRTWDNCRKRVKENLSCALEHIALLLIFMLAIIRMVSGTYNPFIYFQF